MMTISMKAPTLERLPDELLVHILSYLAPLNIVALHGTCRRLRAVTRDDPQVWRSYCFPVKTAITPVLLPPFSQLVRSPRPTKTTTRITQARNRWTDASDCSPLFGTEHDTVDWYAEYKQRNAPLLYTAFRTPSNLEVRNLIISNNTGEDCYALAPLDNGSICLFSLDRDSMGKVLAHSGAGILTNTGTGSHVARNKFKGMERPADTAGNASGAICGIAIEGAAVNGSKGYFAVGSILVEVDLNTLQRVGSHRFPFSITTLSATNNNQPLAIGTTLTLHLHDTRSPDAAAVQFMGLSRSLEDRLDFTPVLTPPATPPHPHTSSLSASLVLDREERYSRDHLLHTPTAFLQPSPLAIQHSPSDQASGFELYVAGRFPSILCYDRRMWPKIRGNMHSGARLSGLTIVPSLFSRVNFDPLVHSIPSKYSLVACGEYAGRGTLEMYPLPPAISSASDDNAPKKSQSAQIQPLYNAATSSALKNRQTASRSKVISVASQGTCLILGDGDGGVKWMESNGVRGVRRWSLDTEDIRSHPNSRHSYCQGRTTEGGCVTRLFPLSSSRNRPEGIYSLLIQVGDGVGYLGVDPVKAELWNTYDSVSNIENEAEEKKYKHMMRKALEQQAAEVRFLEGLGL